MKPIGNNSGTDACPAGRPDGQEVTAPRSSSRAAAFRNSHSGQSAALPTGKVGSDGSVRLEDIVAVAPASVTTKTGSGPAVVERRFADLLKKELGACAESDDVVSVAASVLQNQAGFDFVGRYTLSTGLIGQPDRIEGLTAPFESLPVATQQAIQDVMHQPETVDKTARSSGAVLVAIDGTQSALVGFVRDCSSDGIPTQHRCALEMTAAIIAQRHLKTELQRSEADIRHVAAMAELTSRVSGCTGTDEAAKIVAEDLCRYLNASEVSVGLCSAPGAPCRLAATSGTQVDPRARSTQLAEAVLMECIARGTVSVWPARDNDNRHALLAHQQFAREYESASVIGCPLRFKTDDVTGAVFVTFDDRRDSVVSADQAATFLQAAERPLAAALASVSRSSRGILTQISSGIRRKISGRRLRTLALAVVALVGVMMIPVNYRVECETELQPVSRRFVAAPFDAPLAQCLVEPGDVVEADQLIARLDGREVRWELAGVRADLSKATKEHNAYLSEQKSAEAAIARHEIERLQNQIAVLNGRMDNLEIRSPIAGIVVTGDLKETEGVPLETGQSLFEIAPLDRMVIEVAIPEEDIRHVQTGMDVRLKPDSMPSEAICATIKKIHPRAELRDYENVFIAEAEVDNAERLLRPGMRGGAKVATGSRSLGWTLFHKPVAHVTGWLGW